MASKNVAGQSRPVRHHESWHDRLRVVIPVLLLAGATFAVAWHFVKPAPPGKVVMATGSKQGVYYAVAQKYQQYFAENGVALEIRETLGSVENFKLLTQPDGDVDIAIVQAGSSPAASERAHVQAVAGIYYEAVLVFYRGQIPITQIAQLVGKKIAIGAQESGVKVMSQLLLSEARVIDGDDGTDFFSMGNGDAADALVAKQIDAAFYVIGPDAAVVHRLLETPGVRLMSFDHAHAYSRRHPFLSATTLYRGAIDIQKDQPGTDVQLVAAPATLAIRDSTHEAIIQLLVRAAQRTNSNATLLSDSGVFPHADRSELPINKDANYFLKNKPSILTRLLPFWLASLVDRMIILIIPLLVVLVPLFRMTPTVLRWRVQSRIYRRYKRVRQLEEKLTPDSYPADIRTRRDELIGLEKELATLKLPLSFSETLFNLRGHVSFVRSKLDSWLAAGPAAVSKPPTH